MKRSHFLYAAAALVAFLPLALAQTTRPDTDKPVRTEDLAKQLKGLKPGTMPTTRLAPKIEVSAEAKAVLDGMQKAYLSVKTLSLVGAIVVESDLAGEQQTTQVDFTSEYLAPWKFRHQSKANVILGGDGTSVYFLNTAMNAYMREDIRPQEKAVLDRLPSPLNQLHMMDTSLALALAKDPMGEIQESAKAVRLVKDITIGTEACKVLEVEPKGKGPIIRMVVDPKTQLLRRFEVDRTAMMQEMGIPKAVKALVRIEYSQINPAATPKAESFAFVPPAGARNITSSNTAVAGAAGDSDLVGKAAPEFSLKDLAGNDVALKDQKGKVVVLDFWATWCGPCRASMPELQKIHADLAGKGVVVLAVNLREKPETVKAFIEKNQYAFGVLLDADGNVGNQFGVEGIPHTVVVDKAGKVTLVKVGADDSDTLRKAVEDALK